MAAKKTRRKTPARKPARRKAGGRGTRSRASTPRIARLADLDDSRRDALGLALIAVAAFLAFLMYLGWAGGAVGGVLDDALRFLLGSAALVLPLWLLAAGVALMARRESSARGHLRLGGAVLVAALALGLTAGTASLGPGALPDGEVFNPDYFMDRGGLLGSALYSLASTLFSTAGAHLAFLAMLGAGLLLVTGTSVATLAAALRRAVRRVHRSLASERRRADADATTYYEEPEGDIHVEMADADARPAAGPGEEPEPDTLEHRAQQDGGATEEGGAAEAEALEQVEDDPLADIEREVGAAEGRATERQIELTPQGNRRGGVTESEELRYRLPDPALLKQSAQAGSPDTSNQEQVARTLEETLGHFGIEAKIVGRVAGPRVTRHELRLAPGTKMSKISQLKDDLAYALASTDIRILAPIPGKQAVGVEVPNKRHRVIFLGDIFRRELTGNGKKPAQGSPLSVWLGKDISGQSIWTDLARMPHLLVAGTTGSGKSGCVNTMLSSVLLRATPNEVRLVLVDPKRVELNHYDDIPHLLTPVVTAPRMAANVLANLIREMESRYEVMAEVKARNIVEMNKTRRAAGEPPLPYILCVIDELADLMMVSPAEVEDSIIRLAQKSRAVGIHLVLATQRPSVDIITGTIKVNVPARIAFAVSSQHDSRVILDQGGAESLLGQGDMLFRPVGSSKLQRIQGAYITEEEIARLTAFWRSQGEPDYEQELLESHETPEEPDHDLSPDRDDLLEDAIRLVAQTQTASVSMLQRRLRVGYTRAGRLIDMLERRGVISGYEGSKPRQVLVTESDVERVLAAAAGAGAQEPAPVSAAGED